MNRNKYFFRQNVYTNKLQKQYKIKKRRYFIAKGGVKMTQEAKEARAKYMREYRKHNRERLNEYRKAWAKRNPEKTREYAARQWERKAAQM